MNLRKAARGQPCMKCGVTDESVVLAHYSGHRQHEYGKGRSLKGDDRYAVPLCAECHENSPFAEGYIPPGFEHESRDVRRLVVSEEQLHLILKWRDRNAA